MTSLAIGVVSFGRGRLTQRLLDSIERSTTTPHHVFLADNGSRDSDTLALLDEWEKRPATTVIRLRVNTGAAGGRNAILEAIGEEFDTVAMLDNDNIVLPGWDEAAGNALAAGYDAVDPKFLRKDQKIVDRGPTRPWKERFLLHPEYLGRGVPRDAPEVSKRVEVPVVGGTAIFRAEVFRRVGSYDSRIRVGEDYDFAYRARQAGYRFCYEPECELIHDHPHDSSYDQIRFDARTMLDSHFIIWKRHRKLLLSPSSLWLFTKIVQNCEQMFLDRRSSLIPVLRRIRRKGMRWYAEKRLGEVWRSEEQGERATTRSEALIMGVSASVVSK